MLSTILSHGIQIPTPIVFFVPGWKNANHKAYKKLLKFIVSHGYSVVYVLDSGSYYSQFQKMNAIVNELSENLDSSKIGVLSHSPGGAVFSLLN